MLIVNYITRPWFFDISVELIRELKKAVILNVIIIISPESAGYLGIDDTHAKAYLNKTLKFEEVLKGEQYDRLNPYFEGANVICKFEQHKESSYKNALGWIKLLRDFPTLIKADLNITETLSLADWYFLLRIRNRKVYYIIHDPVPHTGEGRSRVKIIAKLYFPYIKKFITYSEFSALLFRQHYQVYADKVLTLKMPIFTSQNISIKAKQKVTPVKKIVFFGRLSFYKGVELFYSAATALLETNDNLSFIIAGKAHEGYDPGFLTDNNQPDICIQNNFITPGELAEIMADADFCVLPYFDATQSGVIMTCYAFNVPVLVSDCPGLVEYCFDGENFSFENKNLQSLIDRMQNLINNDGLLANYREQIRAYAAQNISLINSNLILDKNIPV